MSPRAKEFWSVSLALATLLAMAIATGILLVAEMHE